MMEKITVSDKAELKIKLKAIHTQGKEPYHIDLKVNGGYEIHFDLPKPKPNATAMQTEFESLKLKIKDGSASSKQHLRYTAIRDNLV